ncbi:tetratricopeptide repeat protein [Candidatus Kaiserbacteria bacterium]|nr:tetratricopeptide repeat protein [Candidatus Kaiserbacteria bacterium]
MTQRSQKITIAAALILAIAVLLLSVAYNRGALTFDGWKPRFSLSAFKNPKPSLDRPITFPADFTQEAQTLFNQQLAKTKAAIEADPSDVSAWFDLAIDYRMVGDYEGAVAIWKYISAKYPTEGISLHNLGEYYFHTAKDYPTAENYYRQSIKVAPHLEQNYLDLADMYTYVYKQDTDATVNILKEGIANLVAPENVNLEIQLAAYYASKGDTADARTYYQQALQTARALKNTTLITQLEKSLSRLK